MSGNASKVIAFNYFGAKFGFLDELYRNFPDSSEFDHLVVTHAGSLVVELNYKHDGKKLIITANEINEEITNFFQVLREHEDDLINLLELTPVSRSEYDRCYEPSSDPVERARRFYVRVRQSRLGLGAQTARKSFNLAKNSLQVDRGEAVSRFVKGVSKLRKVAKLIRANFQITNWDCLDCIDYFDDHRVLFYVDPPYLEWTRYSVKDYAFEFTVDQHIALAQKLRTITGKVMISHYDNDLYDDLYDGWKKVYLTQKKNNLSKHQVQEVVYLNYEPKRQVTQTKLLL